jgi:superfamily II DNA or RNA helicase
MQPWRPPQLSQPTRSYLNIEHTFVVPMDSPMEVNDGDIAPVASADAAFQLRSYQAEMVEASMKDNIIVVMDTGSGKTHM